MKIKNLHHICIQTNKYEESIRFYTEMIGFKVIKETPGFHGRDYNTWLELNGTMIELQTPKGEKPLSPWSSLNEGPVHLSFLVEDIEEAYEEIRGKGHTDFKVKNGEVIYKVENGCLFKIKAPEGTEIEIRDNNKI